MSESMILVLDPSPLPTSGIPSIPRTLGAVLVKVGWPARLHPKRNASCRWLPEPFLGAGPG